MFYSLHCSFQYARHLPYIEHDLILIIKHMETVNQAELEHWETQIKQSDLLTLCILSLF